MPPSHETFAGLIDAAQTQSLWRAGVFFSPLYYSVPSTFCRLVKIGDLRKDVFFFLFSSFFFFSFLLPLKKERDTKLS
jgi:hypothetical protein